MTVATACGSDDDEAAEEAEKKRRAAGASTAFVPADAPEQPALPPGAGPYSGPAPTNNPDPPPPPPPDSGTPDTGSPGDAGDT